ncbi:MAG: RNA methyltransferase [Pseudomonadota bacterium]
MSGTDHSLAHTPQPQPAFVLVGPQMGENIGAAARAMWNFGLDRLRLVAPRDGWPNPRAVAMASGAAKVIDGARVFASTDEALNDLTYTYATTARPRDLTKTVFTPEAALADARARVAKGEQVGLLFGPERAGLANEDVVRANAIITVPVNPAFASLNLAQCVLLCAYEWGQGVFEADPIATSGKAVPASGVEITALRDHLESRLEDVGFFWPEDKRASMIENLRNLISRLDLTDADVRTLHGIVRALSKPPAGR